MSYRKRNAKILKIAGLLICNILSGTAYTQTGNNHCTDKGINETTPYSITPLFTDNKIHLTNKGYSLFLPKIEIKKSVQDWTKIDYIGMDILSKEEIETLKNSLLELSILSEKLGFQVRDVKHIDLYREAANWLGTRYRWAGKSKKGVDCSGFTNIIFKEVYDKELDRSSYVIAKNLSEELDKDRLQPGDLVFFSTRSSRRKSGINHVGVYLGEKRFIHATRGKGVVVSSLDETYYIRTFIKAGRL